MKTIYETSRIILRLFEDGDAQDAMTFWGNEEVMAQSGGAIKEELLTKVFASYNKCYQDKGLTVFAVVEKETEKVIGAAGFNIRDSVDIIELIYHFAKESWGKGYATEAAAACLELAKKHGNVKTIYASADPVNGGSLKILEKICFDYKGLKWFDDSN